MPREAESSLLSGRGGWASGVVAHARRRLIGCCLSMIGLTRQRDRRIIIGLTRQRERDIILPIQAVGEEAFSLTMQRGREHIS